MRSNTTLRRLLVGAALVATLGGALIVAEHSASPAVVGINGKSIAASRPSLPAFSTSPFLTTISPLKLGARTAGPSVAPSSLPSIPGPTFGAPIVTPTCATLLAERQQLLSGPQNGATEGALAVNAFWLAVFHCVPVSGD